MSDIFVVGLLVDAVVMNYGILINSIVCEQENMFCVIYRR